MVEKPWYQTFFDEHYLRRYAPQLTPERSERQVDDILDRLGLEAGARVLDLACGHGRHAIRLAQRGMRVTGFDLSPVCLERARDDARAAGVDVELVQGDLRELPFRDRFDAAINVFTAFGYLESDEEDAKAIAALARALVPDGRFLLETMHRDNLIGRYAADLVERHEDGLLVIHHHRLDLEQSAIEDQVVAIEPTGSREERFTRVRLYTVPEFRRLFQAAGLELEAVYGGLDGSPLTLASPRLALVARRVA